MVVSAIHNPTVNCMMGEDGNMDVLTTLPSDLAAVSAVTLNIFCRSSKTWRRRHKNYQQLGDTLTLQVSHGVTSCFRWFQCEFWSDFLCCFWSLTQRSPPVRWMRSAPHLDVELEGGDGLLQHRRPLLLRQLDAVHPAPVQLLEAVGAAHTGEGEERKPLFAAQPEGLLGDFPQHLTTWQIAEITSVGVGHQQLWALPANLKHKNMFGCYLTARLTWTLREHPPPPLHSPVEVSVRICVWLREQSPSSSSLSPKNAPDLFRAIPGGRVPEGSISARQLDGRNFCPAPLRAPCRSHRGNTAGPGTGIEINICFLGQCKHKWSRRCDGVGPFAHKRINWRQLVCRVYLVLWQGDLALLVTQHQLCVLRSDVIVLGRCFNLLW